MRKALRVMMLLLLLQASAAMAADPVAVIVFPLEAAPEAEALSWLSEGIALSISEQIAGGKLKVLNREERIAVVEGMDLPPSAQLSRGSMIRVAQRAQADMVVLGSFSGREESLKIRVRVLDITTKKLGGEMAANGPLSALPQMENELSWLILGNTGLEQAPSREKFVDRMRRTPNAAYSVYIQSLDASTEKEQLRLLLKAVGAYRDFPEAHFRIGRIYFGRGDCGNALPHLLSGRGVENAGPENDFMCGTCYSLQGSPDQAIQTLSRVLEFSRSFHVLNNLGVACLRKGDLEPALKSLLEARGLAHTDSTVSMNLAIVRHKQGDAPAACGALEDAIKAHPKSGMLQFLLGFFLKAQGERQKAAAPTEKARSLGINVEKLQAEDPLSWSRVFTSWR